eukprot:4839023-Ditylum_brightwellii.AAC.1
MVPDEMVPELDLENDEERDNHYDPRRRQGMRLQRRHDNAPKAHVNVHHHDTKKRKIVMPEPIMHSIMT